MKKKLIIFIILCSIIGAGALKADTKKRVHKLENQVVDLSKSERKAWEMIEAMNKQVARLERQAATRYYQDHQQFAEVDEEQEDDLDDQEVDPSPRISRIRSRR